VIWLYFHVTNNVAKYEALVNGLCIATELGVHRFYIHDESEFVINQVMGESNYHDPHMAAYHQEVRKLEEKFNDF
jgi:ribonuclease HI